MKQVLTIEQNLVKNTLSKLAKNVVIVYRCK